jgi:ATP/maltotriose-dependent transcriptional regulator MalT
MRADYEEAVSYLRLFFEDVEAFDLAFARPYGEWTQGMVSLGLRRFGEAERAIQALEDGAKTADEYRHTINARALRARLFLQLGQHKDALRQVQPEPTGQLIPSWRAEYLATRALAMACLGEGSAIRVGAAAVTLSNAAEVRVLAAAATAVAHATAGSKESASRLMQLADALGTWDPVVCAVRASPALADVLGSDEAHRSELEDLYQRSLDRGLARKAGLRTRATRSPHELLSPRELEVIGLIARGLRNRQISEALFIADSTTKVHIRHIFEKLGVRTRAEAVARYEMFTEARYGGAASASNDSSDTATPPNTKSAPRAKR